MRKSRFTEEQIIKVLKEHAAGLSAGDVCRKYGISDATFYKWRSRYGGMEISDARKLKTLEDENRRLKKLLAETMLDASTLKEMLKKTSNAQHAETCCDLGCPREGLFAAARVSSGRPASQDLSLRDKAVWR
jgi:putative transposase